MFHEEEFILPAGLGRTSFRAMGTTISLLLPEERQEEGTNRVQQLFERWEETLSRFRLQSELSRLNRAAGTQAFVSELLFHVLTEAIQAARTTNGIYDPTMLRQLSEIGYDRTFDEVGQIVAESEYRGEPGGGWRDIRLDGVVRGVWHPKGVQVDFGGIAKGMAVDAALEDLREAGFGTALVNAGGDLRMLGLPKGAEDWGIAIPGKDEYWTLPVKQGALATSGIARRAWQQGQERRHHLLDPRNGLPVENGLWSVTVVARLCVQAEIAAKVAFILGREQGKEFLQKNRLAGLFVHEDGDWEGSGYWPEELMRR